MKKRPARTALPSPAGSLPAGGHPSPVPSSPRQVAPAVVDLSSIAEAIMRLNERLTEIEKKLEPSAEELEKEEAKKFTEHDAALVKGFLCNHMDTLLYEFFQKHPAMKEGMLNTSGMYKGLLMEKLPSELAKEKEEKSHEESIGL